MKDLKIALVLGTLVFAWTCNVAAASLTGGYTCIFNRSFAGFNAANSANGGNPTSTVNGILWIDFDHGQLQAKGIETTKFGQQNAGTKAYAEISGTMQQVPLGNTGNRFKVNATFPSGSLELAVVRVNKGNSLYAVYPYSEDPSDRFAIEPAYLVCNRS